MRGWAPTFRDLQSMTDADIVKMMMPQMACFKCGRSSGLNVVETGEIGRNEQEGLRKVGAVIHCPTCGLLNHKIEATIPMTELAWREMFAIGQIIGHARRAATAWRPGKSRLTTGMGILKKFGIDHLVDRGS